MQYTSRYMYMEEAVADFSAAAKALDTHAQQLRNIRDSGLSFSSTRSSINSQFTSINTLSACIRIAGECLDEVKGTYCSAEQLSSQIIGGVNSVSAAKEHNTQVQSWHNGFRPEVSGIMAGAAVTGTVIFTSQSTNQKAGSNATITKNAKAGWWDNVKSGVKNGVKTVYNVGKKAVKKKISEISTTVAFLQDNFGKGGRYEGVWKAAKSSVKFISAVTVFTVSLATVNPLGIVYGANSLISSGADLWHVSTGEYDKVGKVNVMNKLVKTAGETIGENLGAGIGLIINGDEGAKTGATLGKSMGSAIGEIVNTGLEIYTGVSVAKTAIGGNTVKELTKVWWLDAAKESVEAVDAVVEGEVIGWGAKNIVGEYIDDYISNDHDIPEQLDVYNEFLKKSAEKAAEKLAKPDNANIEPVGGVITGAVTGMS